YRPPTPPHLPSFPTRRSSDLTLSPATTSAFANGFAYFTMRVAVPWLADRIVFSDGSGNVSRSDFFDVVPFACGLDGIAPASGYRSEEHTCELQSLAYLVCRLL